MISSCLKCERIHIHATILTEYDTQDSRKLQTDDDIQMIILL